MSEGRPATRHIQILTENKCLDSTETECSEAVFAHRSSFIAHCLFSFGGSVNPNTEIIPLPATLTLLSPGVGKYNALQFSQR